MNTKNTRGVPAFDTRAEYPVLPDDGCEIAPSCLRCPLPQCKYDDPGGVARARKQARDQQVLDAYYSGGMSWDELVRKYHLSERTLRRIIAAEQKEAL